MNFQKEKTFSELQTHLECPYDCWISEFNSKKVCRWLSVSNIIWYRTSMITLKHDNRWKTMQFVEGYSDNSIFKKMLPQRSWHSRLITELSTTLMTTSIINILFRLFPIIFLYCPHSWFWKDTPACYFKSNVKALCHTIQNYSHIFYR